MIGAGAKPNLAEALSLILSVTHWHETQRTSWNSATFEGIRILYETELFGDDAMAKAKRFANILPQHDFDLRRYFVAEIHVAAITPTDSGAHLTVEALLIDE
jgi:hypothetical protein